MKEFKVFPILDIKILKFFSNKIILLEYTSNLGFQESSSKRTVITRGSLPKHLEILEMLLVKNSQHIKHCISKFSLKKKEGEEKSYPGQAQ